MNALYENKQMINRYFQLHSIYKLQTIYIWKDKKERL